MDFLTSEEQNVLANYHLNLARNYINDILSELNRENKAPDFDEIHKMDVAFNREITIVKYYKPNDEG